MPEIPDAYGTNKKAQQTQGLYARQRHHSKMAAVPRWPSAAILDIIEPEIAPFDPPTPKTLAYDQTWSGSDAPFARYSPLIKLHSDLETGVRGHSRSSNVALFDRAHTTLYSSSIVTMPVSSTLSEI